MSRVDGKVSLVSGGASGIGRAVCQTLAREGATVVVADIDEAGGEQTVNSIGSSAVFMRLDVTSESQWQRVVAKTMERLGKLNVLVNCAGIGFSGIFEETLLEDWNKIVAVNMTGLFLGCKHGVIGMKASAVIAGVVGGGDIAAYSATKGGVTLLSKSVALSCAERGSNIRCNSIHPTYVDSEMLDPIAELYPNRDAMRSAMSENIPLGRMATPQDIANPILFLASDESAMMTGSTVMVDGGTTAGVTSKHSAD